MRFSSLSRNRLSLVAACVLVLSQFGCDAVKDAASDVADRASDAVNGDSPIAPGATPDTNSVPAPTGGAPASAAAEPAKPDPAQVISNFMSLPSNKITEANMVELASLESGLDEVTELKLSGAFLGPAGMEALSKLTALKKLEYGACQLRGSGYAPIAKLKNLEHLNLEGSLFDNAAMQYLSGLTNLKELILSDTQISDVSFRPLGNLKNLEVIRIRKTNTDGSGFEVFKGAPLRVIEAGKTSFGSYGYKFVSGFPNLEVLATSDARVSDNSLKGLRGCNNLKELSLGNNLISDAGLKNLGGLKSLEKLSLSQNNGVTNVGLVVMKKLKNVTWLDINGTRCTDQAAMELQKLLPNADILYKGQTL